MYGYHFNNHQARKAEIVGWSGVFRSAIPVYYKSNSNYLRSNKPIADYVHGIISLYPRRVSRWDYFRDFGWAELDLYYKVHKLDTIDKILSYKPKTSALFWGTIRERLVSDTDFKEHDYEFSIEGMCTDKSQGRHSYIQATLQCSDPKELLGL